MAMRRAFLFAMALALLIVGAAHLPVYGQGPTRIYLPLATLQQAPFLVGNLAPGPAGVTIQSFTALGERLIFGIDCTLWSATPAPDTARQVRTLPDLSRSGGCPRIGAMATYGAFALFMVYESDGGARLWRSDGSSVGTVALAHFPASATGAQVMISIIPAVGRIYLVQDQFNPDTSSLWISDGTAAGTRLVRDFGGNAIFGSALIVDKLVFGLNHPDNTSELWVSDGTPASTQLLKETGGFFAGATAGGKVWFASSGEGGYQLWVSDGTPAGTGPVRTFDGLDAPGQFVTLGDTIYFTMCIPISPYYYDLWTSDGTLDGTRMIVPQQRLEDLTPFAGRLFFTGEGALYRSDGVAATAFKLADPQGWYNLYPTEDRLFLNGPSTSGRPEIWLTDGSDAGLRRLRDLLPGSDLSSPFWLAHTRSALFFTAEDRVNGRELWALPFAHLP